jgi:hypothetical protein
MGSREEDDMTLATELNGVNAEAGRLVSWTAWIWEMAHFVCVCVCVCV